MKIGVTIPDQVLGHFVIGFFNADAENRKSTEFSAILGGLSAIKIGGQVRLCVKKISTN